MAYTDVKDPVSFSHGTTRNNTRNTLVGVGYDFDVVRLYAHLGRIRSDGSARATQADDNITFKVWDVSVLVQLGLGRVMLAYGVRKGDERFSSERKLAAPGYAYTLSKRADIYALLRDDRNRAAGTLRDELGLVGTRFSCGMGHS